MNKIRTLHLLSMLLVGMLFSSCSAEESVDADYSFEVARDVTQSISDFHSVEFSTNKNLDLGFYEGEVWIKLEISNGTNPASFIVLCNDLINQNYRFYKLDTSTNTFIPRQIAPEIEKYDHRSFNFAKPNFQVDLDETEQATFLITTSSDGRILQATPKLISINEFLSVKQQTQLIDIVFYITILLLLLINLFYFRLIRSDIYYYYGAYILSSCLMYLFVEGRLYRLGATHVLVDHLMFIAIRIWILANVLFTVTFLETRTTNPGFYKFIIAVLVLTLLPSTIYQLIFPRFSISTLHMFENIIGFVWIILSLVTVRIAFKKRKVKSTYYLISYSCLLLFVLLGLIDSHTTILPGDPFSYFKIGTVLEFIGFTYFITLLVKQKLTMNERLEKELSESRKELQEKEKMLASKNTDLVSVFKLIENSFSSESDWNDFKQRFEKLDANFVTSLEARHSDLSKSEIRLLTLIRIGYSQKEIANILNIAPDSVKKARSRTRKKLNLQDSVALADYLLKL
ncbi:MAG: 7TM diverse intracellular signaling domain-containing protein [Cyclobacteriaceae bacterium]